MPPVTHPWSDFPRSDYVKSGLSDSGCWDESGQIWHSEPASRAHVDRESQLLVIGRPGVDGVPWGYRSGMQGIWAFYPLERERAWLAESVCDLRDGCLSGRITA